MSGNLRDDAFWDEPQQEPPASRLGTRRKGDKATFTGSFLRYDDGKRTLWLQNCVQTKK